MTGSGGSAEGLLYTVNRGLGVVPTKIHLASVTKGVLRVCTWVTTMPSQNIETAFVPRC